MTHFRQGLRSSPPPIDTAIWTVIGLCAAMIGGFALWASFEIAWHSFLAPGAIALMLLAGAWFYRSVRHEHRLAAIMSSTAGIIGFAAVAAPLSYIAAAANQPLQDATFEAWDHALHFDWMQMTMLVATHPYLQTLLMLAYSSFALQAMTTLLGLGITGQLARLNAFMVAFIATTLTTIAVSALYPAGGPFLFHHLSPSMIHDFQPPSSTSWPVFLGLRDHTLNTLYGLRSEGIITFPSLHAALGVLFAMALWRTPIVRWIALGLNGLMLIATPAFGSHYLVDVIAGVFTAVIWWMVAARLCDVASKPEQPVIRQSPSIVPEAMQETPCAPDIVKRQPRETVKAG